MTDSTRCAQCGELLKGHDSAPHAFTPLSEAESAIILVAEEVGKLKWWRTVLATALLVHLLIGPLFRAIVERWTS
jgi:hypothetical protein